MMIVAAARELAGQHVCFVGVGLPNIAVNLAKRTVAPDLELVYEAGVFGARPARLPLSIGDPTIVTGATAVVSMLELFGYYLQRGLIDVGFLGAAQIDRFGNINTTVIGDVRPPDDPPAGLGRRLRDRDQRPRGLRDHAPESKRSFVERSTSGRRPATSAAPRRRSGSGARAAGSAAGPSVVVTDLGIYHFDDDGEMRLDSLHPGATRRGASARRSAGTWRSRRTWPPRPPRPPTSCASSARSSTRAASTRSSGRRPSADAQDRVGRAGAGCGPRRPRPDTAGRRSTIESVVSHSSTGSGFSR